MKLPPMPVRRKTSQLCIRSTDGWRPLVFRNVIPARRDKTLCEDAGIDNFDNPEFSKMSAEQYIQLIAWYKAGKMTWEGSWSDFKNCHTVADFKRLEVKVIFQFGGNRRIDNG